MKDFVEVTSISGKKWQIRISEIGYITKRSEPTEKELKALEKIEITEKPSDFTLISLIHINTELWVKESYEEVVKKIQNAE